MMADAVSIYPIGILESCFGEKFGTPRQSGLVPSARGRVNFFPEVAEDSVRGLEEFSHVWLLYLFDQVPENEVRWLVRPPRLGGNEKKGVFATRSPFRPNRIGLSLVRLEAVLPGIIDVSGIDIVDGTPIIDVKPYLPFVESIPDAVGGFASEPPCQLDVVFSEETCMQLSGDEKQLVREVLAHDPRPAYHEDPHRIYGCQISGRNVTWQCDGRTVKVIEVRERS